MCAAFVGIAVIAAIAASVAVDQFRSAVTAPQSDGGRRITIARDSVERTLSADDAAKREAEVLRQHRAEEQRTAARISREALLLGDIAYGAAEADVRALYGAPLETESERSMRYAGKAVVEYEYGDHLSLDFVDGFVRRVWCMAKTTSTSLRKTRPSALPLKLSMAVWRK